MPFDRQVEIAKMNYTHLTREERYQIYALKKAGHKQSEIANVLERSESTISRELSRNCGRRGYRPRQAHSKSVERQSINARTIDDATWQFAQERLLEQWSPEQISGHAAISPETVYQRVYANKRAGGLLWKNLRCQKQLRKRYGKAERRGTIPNRLSIDDRPAIVETRSRIGDWEADTVIGKNHRQAIVSIVERKTGFTLIRKVERKTAQAVSQAMIVLLKPHRKKVHTITSDNGKEFAGHEEIANKLKADFYFAHPYSSWERGTNENTNGLIRQYFPKNRDFTTITQQEIDTAMERLNNRPRKRLGYQTPNQVFFKSGVALHI
ncbi:MAG: integrase [Candidatus Gallionella acididurans]|uniref:Integrase n=1 Tax=Candidatus Gallionella acididurans TaxID=1796491 RepID=A0A139BSS7_9PROT|nr:MAG: integrase [Candidatus Gallionella acididurans]